MLNLIWVQLEAYGALNEEKNCILNKALGSIDYKTINLSQAICAAPSTVMTTMGLLTGVFPILLAKDHVPKSQPIPDDWQAAEFTTITDFLEDQNYDVVGINAVYDSPRCLPIFKDTHAGLSPDMKKKEGYNFWEAWCIPERLRNISPSLSKDKKAFFFHLIDADTLTEIIDELNTIGLSKDNTVLVLVGDHGWPIRFKEKEPALFHDLHQEENNIRVACHIAYPDCSNGTYNHFSSGLDLAPTALELMGFDTKAALPKADGISLVHYLKNNTQAPDRIIRIDNRYVAQRKNKIITLVTSKLRYTFRYETSWAQQPYYKYKFQAIEENEELYLRSDLEEKNNLIGESTYQGYINTFREFFRKTESEALTHFYSKNLFEHYLLSGRLPEQENSKNQRIHSSSRILKSILTLLNQQLTETGIDKTALYGAGNHTRGLLKHNIINSKVVVIFDDNPLFNEIEGYPVLPTEEHEHYDFDTLILSSDYFESQLKEQATLWLPKKKKIIVLYDEIGKSLSSLIIQSIKHPSFNELIDKIITLSEPKNSLTLVNTVKLKNYFTTKILPSKNTSFKEISNSLPEVKFDLIAYQSRNVFEFSEWLSRIDELLDTCGFFIGELTDICQENTENSITSIIPDDFKYEVLKLENSFILVGHLWRFNS